MKKSKREKHQTRLGAEVQNQPENDSARHSLEYELAQYAFAGQYITSVPVVRHGRTGKAHAQARELPNRQNLCPCEKKGHTQAGGCPRDRREYAGGRATSDVGPTEVTKGSTEKSSRSGHIATSAKPANLVDWLVGRKRDGFRD